MALRSHLMLLLFAHFLALALGEDDGSSADYPTTASSATTFSTSNSSSGSTTSTTPLPKSSLNNTAAQVAPPASSSSFSNASANSRPVVKASINSTASGGTTLQAPQPDDPVPGDAAIYYPNGTDIDMTDFFHWRQSVRAKQLSGTGQYASRFMKVQAGNYNRVYTDPSHNNIDVTFWSGGWTLDLRGVTISYPFDSSHDPSPAIYVNQAGPTFTILGGTFWIDVGEIWSQATVTSVVKDPVAGYDMYHVTATIQDGYDPGVWVTEAAKAVTKKFPPAINCVDVFDPNHYTRPNCNFWYLDLPTMRVDGRIIDMHVTSRAGVKEGYVLAIPTGVNMGGTFVDEENAGLTVRGLTTNGGFTYIGANRAGPPVYKNVWVVNPPPRAGYVPRVNGPSMSWGHIGNFNLCQSPPCETYPDSWWQYTGNPKDVTAMTVELKLPAS